MIELTQEQLQALDAQEHRPAAVIDPRTREEFVLIRREVYDKLRGFLRPLGRAWDNADDDDLIRKNA